MGSLITTNEAAGTLGVSSRRVLQLFKDGELTGQKIGRDVLIDSDSLETAKDRKTKRGPAPKSEVKEQPAKKANAPTKKKKKTK